MIHTALFVFTALVVLITASVIFIQGLFYSFRWYELASQRYKPNATWLNSLSYRGFQPLRVFMAECAFLFRYGAAYMSRWIRKLLFIPVKDFEPGEMIKGQPLIVMIHGLFGRPEHFIPMKRRLRSKDVANVALFEYNSLSGNIEDHTDKLIDFITRVRSKTGIYPTIFICHSMGGLVALEYIRKYDTNNEVLGLIALGTPFRGSGVTAMSLSKSARMLHPKNPYFSRVLEYKPNLGFLNLYSTYDQLVIPYTNSIHTHATENREMDCCGHTGLIYSKKAFRHVLHWIVELTRPKLRNLDKDNVE